MIPLILLIVAIVSTVIIVFTEILNSMKIKKDVLSCFGKQLTDREKRRMNKSGRLIYYNAQSLSEYNYRELKNTVFYNFDDGVSFESNLVNCIIATTALLISIMAVVGLSEFITDLIDFVALLVFVIILVFLAYSVHLVYFTFRKRFLKKYVVAINLIDYERTLIEYPSAVQYPARSASAGRPQSGSRYGRPGSP